MTVKRDSKGRGERGVTCSTGLCPKSNPGRCGLSFDMWYVLYQMSNMDAPTFHFSCIFLFLCEVFCISVFKVVTWAKWKLLLLFSRYMLSNVLLFSDISNTCQYVALSQCRNCPGNTGTLLRKKNNWGKKSVLLPCGLSSSPCNRGSTICVPGNHQGGALVPNIPND